MKNLLFWLVIVILTILIVNIDKKTIYEKKISKTIYETIQNDEYGLAIKEKEVNSGFGISIGY